MRVEFTVKDETVNAIIRYYGEDPETVKWCEVKTMVSMFFQQRGLDALDVHRSIMNEELEVKFNG